MYLLVIASILYLRVGEEGAVGHHLLWRRLNPRTAQLLVFVLHGLHHGLPFILHLPGSRERITKLSLLVDSESASYISVPASVVDPKRSDFQILSDPDPDPASDPAGKMCESVSASRALRGQLKP